MASSIGVYFVVPFRILCLDHEFNDINCVLKNLISIDTYLSKNCYSSTKGFPIFLINMCMPTIIHKLLCIYMICKLSW